MWAHSACLTTHTSSPLSTGEVSRPWIPDRSWRTACPGVWAPSCLPSSHPHLGPWGTEASQERGLR